MNTFDNELDFIFCKGADAFCSSGFEIQTDSSNLQANTWYHVVATFNDAANDAVLYVNGVPPAQTVVQGAETDSIVSTTHTVVISELADGEECDCVMDDVRLYNRALSPAEVKQLYQLGTVIIRP